ncbi:flagellar basal body-associated FliL family protein [Sphingomonas sp. UYAg733]
MSDIVEDVKAPKKKGGLIKKLMIGVGLLVLVGGGVGAGLYASGAGLFGGAHAESGAAGPKLVAKSDQKRASEAGGEGHGEEAAGESGGKPTPKGSGGDKFASNYYAMEKEFTSNLQDSVHFVQVGIAISTPYDDTVIDNLKTNEIAVRSAILMALGDTSEEQVFTVDGKIQLQRKLAKAINDTLKEKEGFGGVGNVYFTNFVVQ